MEPATYLLIALLLPMLGSAATLIVFLTVARERARPSPTLVTAAGVSAFVSLVLLLTLKSFLGDEVSSLPLIAVVISWLMVAPVVIKGWVFN